MDPDDVVSAYDSPLFDAEAMLGAVVSPHDLDRQVIEPWARQVAGPILDIGSGTGRWTGHLTSLGHDIVGLEPARKLIAMARKAHPASEFRQGDLAGLRDSDQPWAGLLAWYSVIHMGPDLLLEALAVMRSIVEEDGSLLMSFFTGPRLEAMDHPVATAYRWPLPEMTRALEQAGFDLVDSRTNPGHPHAHLLARPHIPAGKSTGKST